MQPQGAQLAIDAAASPIGPPPAEAIGVHQGASRFRRALLFVPPLARSSEPAPVSVKGILPQIDVLHGLERFQVAAAGDWKSNAAFQIAGCLPATVTSDRGAIDRAEAD